METVIASRREINTVCFDFDGTLVDYRLQLIKDSEEIVQDAVSRFKTVIILTGNSHAKFIIGSHHYNFPIEEKHIYLAPMSGTCPYYRKGEYLSTLGYNVSRAVLFDDDMDNIIEFIGKGGLAFKVTNDNLRGQWDYFLSLIKRGEIVVSNFSQLEIVLHGSQ